MFTWLLFIASIALTYTSKWWWCAVVTLGAIKAFQWHYYRGRPWRRIHYPAMRAYASAAGSETADANNNDREFDIKNALIRLLGLMKPEWEQAQVEQFIDREIERATTYSDETLIRDAFRRSNSKANEDDLNQLMESLKQSLNVNDNGWLVRAVIAGLIENEYSTEDRGEYLMECVTGRAK